MFNTGSIRAFLSMNVRCMLSALLLCTVTGVFAASAQSATSDAPAYADTASLLSTYKLAAGDVITIRIFGEDDLSREKVRLSDAGTIPYPALGEIKALGMTIGELERIITAGLKNGYLVNPRVSVQIEEYRPFYINGMVEKPGGYPFQPGLTVMKASSLAGGFKERASFGKISIIRENNPKAGPQKADLTSSVFPGDTVFIDESFF
jgi:polysaccharide export outer membrane protein